MAIPEFFQSRQRGWAYRMALSVREAFAIRGVPNDGDLERVLDALNLDIAECDLPGDLSEVLTDGLVVLRPGLAGGRRRWALAHAIGHALGHAGNQARIDRQVRWRQERQADVFAGWLLLAGSVDVAWSAWDLAQQADMPMALVVQWFGWLAS